MAQIAHADELNSLDTVALPARLSATAADAHRTSFLSDALDFRKHARIQRAVSLADKEVTRAVHRGYCLRVQMAGFICGKTPAKIHSSALRCGDGADLRGGRANRGAGVDTDTGEHIRRQAR